MKLKAQCFDFASGNVAICFLHSKDAKDLQIENGQRVHLQNRRFSCTAVVDITHTHHFLKRDTLGLLEETYNLLKAKDGDVIRIRRAKKPVSISFIKKKLDGKELTDSDFYAIVKDVVSSELSEPEIAYFISGCYTRGLSTKEIEYLTMALSATGKVHKLDAYPLILYNSVFEEHSYPLSVLVATIVAAVGMPIPLSFSRDESPLNPRFCLKQFRVKNSTLSDYEHILPRSNSVFTTDSELGITPGSFILRDLEHPISVYPVGLLIAQVLAKKFSLQATHLLVDIPYGKGSKISTKEKAEFFSKELTSVGKRMKINLKTILSDGSEPLSPGIGGALMLKDVYDVLKDSDTASRGLIERAMDVAGEIFSMTSKSNGRKIAKEVLESGQALDKLNQLITMHGGDYKSVKDMTLARFKYTIRSTSHSIVLHHSQKKLYTIAAASGAPEDPSCGVYLHKEKHDRTLPGEPLITIYANSKKRLQRARELFEELEPIEFS